MGKHWENKREEKELEITEAGRKERMSKRKRRV